MYDVASPDACRAQSLSNASAPAVAGAEASGPSFERVAPPILVPFSVAGSPAVAINHSRGDGAAVR